MIQKGKIYKRPIGNGFIYKKVISEPQEEAGVMTAVVATWGYWERCWLKPFKENLIDVDEWKLIEIEKPDA